MQLPNTAVVVTGSRDVDRALWHFPVFDALNQIRQASDRMILIHGDCPDPRYDKPTPIVHVSIDKLADRWATARAHDGAIGLLRFPADWARGKSAGPVRNRLMINTLFGLGAGGWNQVVLAFHPDLEHSKGTGQCVEYARSQGFNVMLHSGTDQGSTILLSTRR